MCVCWLVSSLRCRNRAVDPPVQIWGHSRLLTADLRPRPERANRRRQVKVASFVFGWSMCLSIHKIWACSLSKLVTTCLAVFLTFCFFSNINRRPLWKCHGATISKLPVISSIPMCNSAPRRHNKTSRDTRRNPKIFSLTDTFIKCENRIGFSLSSSN